MKLLTLQEAERELAQPGWSIHEELSTSAERVYTSDDGRGLCVYAELDAMLWDTVRAMSRTLRGESTDIVAEMLDESFPSRLEGLISGLQSLSGLLPEQLDYSIESLGALEEVIAQQGERRFLTRVGFPMVLAYAGETLRRAVEGSLKMVRVEDGWIPEISSAADTTDWHLDVFKGLHESDRSLEVEIESILLRAGVDLP